MTEFEINKAVAKKAGIKNLVKFDPCNNAQQAWDIMITNHICILDIGDNYVAFNVKGKSVDKHKLDVKPFVAAMLLFLEI